MQVIPNRESKSRIYGDLDKVELHPKLEELLNAMWLKCPAFVFEKEGCESEKVTRCNVLLGYEKLGYVDVSNVYTRNGYVMMWRVCSPRIHNTRGDRNIKKSKNMKPALNTALEVFQPTAKKDLALRILKVTTSSVNSVVNNAQRPLERLVDTNAQMAFNYCLNYFNSKDERPDLPKNLKDLFESKQFKDASDNARISSSVYNELTELKTGVVIRVERDDTINVVDVETETLSSLQSTYDLPKNYQEKFTILKVMENNQPIIGVGIKVEYESRDPWRDSGIYYYLVGGETPVVD